jgi:ribosomal protein S18 acetylase RimI-like enzyme
MSADDWAPPDRAAVLAVIGAGWAPAETEALGGWEIRRGLGGGRRAGAVRALGDPGMPLEEAIARAAARQRAWGERPCFQIGPDDADLDARLAGLAYAREGISPVMVGAAAAVAEAGRGKRMVLRVTTPLVALEELWAANDIGAARQAVMARTPLPKMTLMLREDDRVAAAAFVAVSGRIATMSALLIAPAFRRRGLGRETVAAAARVGLEMGADTLAFSVEAENTGARALYEGLGLRQISQYHYRTASLEAAP